MVNRSAWVALISLIVLIFVGATVRATGAGLGCPDWPTCWGCLIPPTHVDQIDVEKIDLEKFRRQADRRGIDPDSITRDTLLASFNATHTWIEFLNRLTSLPLGFAALTLAFSSLFWRGPRRKLVLGLAWLSLLDVLFNAYLGAVVVRSGLRPGIITAHMAMAFFLICVLVTLTHITGRTERPALSPPQRKQLLVLAVLFCIALLFEGLLGSQVREQTDQLAKAAGATQRSEWIAALESTTLYLVHRSFSWTLLLLAVAQVVIARRTGLRITAPHLIFALVTSMMIMGVVLAHVAVFAVIQILHVGTTAILLAVAWSWILQLSVRQPAEVSV